MRKTNQQSLKFSAVAIIFGGALAICGVSGSANALARQTPSATAPTPHRTRLYLKDGSYQVVMSYRVVGDRVRYVSAERGGDEEEVPRSLVDFAATQKWEQEHSPAAQQDQAPPPNLDPELLKEEAERRALTPEVAPDLRLPQQDSVVVMDTFHGEPELVPLVQTDGDLNHTTSHSILKSIINPMASEHRLLLLNGESAAVQLHVSTPVFYIRLGDDAGAPTGSTPLVVDTHGASSAVKNDEGASPDSQYVILRTDVRENARLVASFTVNRLGEIRQQADLVKTAAQVLPGSRWMKLTVQEPLTFGEYALVEVISPKELNLGVWDFGVHPTAPDNRDAVKPQSKRPVELERREPQ